MEHERRMASSTISESAIAPESTRPGPCLLRAIAALRAACVSVAILTGSMGAGRALALASMPGMDGGGGPFVGAGVGRAFALASMPGMDGGGGAVVGAGVAGGAAAGGAVALGPLTAGM